MTTYSLQRTPAEYERLQAQARMWEPATARLIDRIGLGAGARCLDAGCGPGETLRWLARRVGPAGSVTGIDSDAGLVATTRAALGDVPACRVLEHDVTAGDLPDGPYDLVFARLLLVHLPSRVEVLRRLWAAVVPGGHLVVQDFDLPAAHSVPESAGVGEVARLVTEAFTAAGCDVQAGPRLPTLLESAGVGEPDGTDVSGLLVPLAQGSAMLSQVLRSLLPSALANGVTTAEAAEAALATLAHEGAAHPTRPLLWPLLIGIWKT